jgi:hypothetical protein
MQDFKLPIEYQRKYDVPGSMAEDLELVHSRGDGKSMYDVLLAPNTDMAHFAAERASHFYTDDTQYLKESVALVRKVDWNVYGAASSFATVWKEHQGIADFNALFHFVEHPRLERLNHSTWLLFILSIQSILSPLLFMISPLIVLIIPFAILQLTQKGVCWESYKVALTEVLKRHALGSIFFGPKNLNGIVSSGAALGLFLVQLYTSVQSCWQFHRNLHRVHTFLDQSGAYFAHTIVMMHEVEAKASAKFQGFAADVRARRVALQEMKALIDQVEPFKYGVREVKQLGYIRYIFYKMKHEVAWTKAIDYSLGFHGYVENMSKLKNLLAKKRVAPCRFGGKHDKGGVRFTKIHYPPHSDHKKHTYALTKKIGKLVTGPNASGKTTYIKSAMLGVLFSQQFGCGFYQKATLTPFQELCCYLNIPDTSGRDSLFQAEARRCKEILDRVKNGRRMFCIFDELFSGTNPYEASASAYGVLTHLSNQPNVWFLLTTHFLDLCIKLDESPKLQNVHLKTTRNPDQSIRYDYSLVLGISDVKGGVQVLQDLKFPATVIECAKSY